MTATEWIEEWLKEFPEDKELVECLRRGRQVFPRRDLSQSLQQAFQQSGVAATELYDFDADKAAFSSALDAACAF